MASLTTAKERDNPGEGILALIRTKYPGYHPLMSIVDLAHETGEDVSPDLRFKCHATIARYITPELKSVEVRATIEDRRRVVVSLFGEGDIEDAVLLEDKSGDSEVLPAISGGEEVGQMAVYAALDEELEGLF